MILTDVLAGAAGGWRSRGRSVAADVAVGESLSGVDDTRRSARHWRKTAADTATRTYTDDNANAADAKDTASLVETTSLSCSSGTFSD